MIGETSDAVKMNLYLEPCIVLLLDLDWSIVLLFLTQFLNHNLTD